jgi:RND family efflux transporter MFP subunit
MGSARATSAPFLFALLLVSAGAVYPQTNASSVLVQSVPLDKRNLLETLASYGTLVPPEAATRNVNVPHAGEVLQVMISLGAVVKKGTPLLTVGTDPFAAAAYAQALSAVEFSRSEVQRTEELLTQRLATRSQLAAAKKALADAEAAFVAQRRLGTDRRSETLIAPYDAVVTILNVHEGDRFQPNAPILQLARSGALRAQLSIDPEDTSRVKIGMKVELTPVFKPQQQITGTVDQIHGVINPQTRLVEVLARLDSGAEGLIAGTAVRGSFILANALAWTVPRSAVLTDDQGAYVFQVDNGHAKRVNVRTRQWTGELVGIEGDLNPRLPVVVLGNYELLDGMAVREQRQ